MNFLNKPSNKRLIFITSLIIFPIITSLILLRLFAANTIHWDFASSEQYSKSESDKLSISAGTASLTFATINAQDGSQADFEQGTNLNTTISNGQLTLGDSGISTSSTTSGLTAQWKFEDNWNDDKNTFNGNPINGPLFAAGKVGRSAYFDGINDYLDFTDGYINTTNYTISLWVKPETTTYLGSQSGSGTACYTYQSSNKYVIVPQYIDAGGVTNLGFSIGTNGVTICEHQNSLMPYNLVHAVDLTGWNHVVIVNNNNTISLYINGTYIKDASSSGKSRYFSFPYLNNSTNGYKGSIDELAIYSVALSSSEIQSLYKRHLGYYGEFTSRIIDTGMIDGADWGNFTWTPSAPYWKELPNNQATESSYPNKGVNMTGNIGLWHFNGNWLDSSGNGNNGSAAGNATPSSSAKIGSNGAFFDGSGDYVTIPDSPLLRPTNTLTISAWSRLSGSQVNNGFVGKRYADLSDPYNSYLLGSNGFTYVFCISNGTGGSQSCINTSALLDNTWYHVAGVYDGATMKLYINGVLNASGNKTGNIGYSALPLTIGAARTSGDYYKGWLDEVAIFNRALQEQEIQNMYSRTKSNVKFQIRSCDDPVCNDEIFKGIDGTNNTYYSDLSNSGGNLPSFSTVNIPNNRYFQYKAILETDTVIDKPMLSIISATYQGYSANKPYVNPVSETILDSNPKSFDKFCEGTLDINGNCAVTSQKPVNTEIYYQLCNDTINNCNNNGTWKYWDGDSWENAQSSNYNTANVINTNIPQLIPTTRYIAFRAFLSSQGQSTPVLSDITISASLDGIAPTTNASFVNISNKNADDWVISLPTLSWIEGLDDPEGVGILGYCVALDESPIGNSQLLNPATTAGLLDGIDDGVTPTFCPFIATDNTLSLNSLSGLQLTTGLQYNVSLKAVDYSGNIYNGTEYQDLNFFKYDGAPPSNPAFVSMPSNFLKTKDVTITWPIIGSDSAQDNGAGVAGLQYKIGSNGTWYGDLHNGNQDLTDLLNNDGAYTTHPDFDYPNLIDGNNVIYLRTLDNAGNISISSISGLIKINTTAPSSVENLSVTPLDNTLNSYAFTWDPPTTYIGEVNLITYCYTVNTLPNENNCTYTNPGVTNLISDSYATQPGTNHFYIVARDEAGNINYDTYSSISFTYSGAAPGMPSGISAADISSKENADWKLAVTWTAPSNAGAGIANYRVYRSTITNAVCSSNLSDFNIISTVSGTSYIDTSLEQRDYYYCVKACDSANNCSAVSGTTSKYPTGKYTTPANLITEPYVTSTTTRKAVINWTTDRRSDSKVAYGLSSNNYFEAESAVSAKVTAHTVTLDNLVAGTQYFFRATWTDEDGNTGISEEKSFMTAPAPHVVASKVAVAGLDFALIEITVRDTAKITLIYGANGALNTTKSISTSNRETTYTLRLDPLQDGTTYTYQMELEDNDGYRYRPQETHTFTTIPRPLISNVTIEEAKNVAQPTVRIDWESNTNITSIVSYSQVADTDKERDAVDLEMKTIHHLEISGLIADTKYVMMVKGTDSMGNQALSSVHYFTTATDSRPPAISKLKVESLISESNMDTAQLVVSWETDEPSTSQIEYGEGSGGGYSQSTQIDKTLSFKHVVIITNLKPANVYHFKALSQDANANISESKNNVTITPKKSDNALDIVLRGLEGIFSFL
jgi:hypothetical protein